MPQAWTATGVFVELGAIQVDVAVPNVAESIADWSILCAVESALAHERTYPARKSAYGPVLASLIETGRTISAIEFQRCLQRRMELRTQFAELFSQIDGWIIAAEGTIDITAVRLRLAQILRNIAETDTKAPCE